MDSKLQIISGKYKGKKLRIPPCSRPTQQKARGAVFNMLAEFVANGDWFVWDAFAGSGAMGMEFISRFNAKSAIFTDVNASAVRCVKENTKNITDCKIIVKKNDAMQTIKKIPMSNSQFVIFIDPPYSAPILGEKLLANLTQNAPNSTIAVLEIENDLPFNNPHWNILKDKTCGRARFLILKRNIPVL
ncbi:MAG: RsmD family RNA methyltransferase [Rickettsiales bacterium]|jgi:16S rRNA (guanine966-N2)-methyltransferase|nr:RsmD family RNA methyltransferase [Rickettsiales bacterium]